MYRRGWLLLILMVASVWANSSTSLAAPPWQKLLPFKRVDADPKKAYPLTADNGPWLIMAATFSGDNAREQAQELVYELRSRYKLPAYTYEVVFDYTKTTEFRGINRYGAPRKGKYNLDKKIDEIAVLAGEFTSVDDPAAQKTLDKLKRAPIDCMDLNKRTSEGKKDSRSMGALRYMQDAVIKTNTKKEERGPLSRAFIASNPLIPREYFAPKGLDKVVLSMNENVEHSLLKCRGKYTVKVATFTGRVEIDQNKIKRLENGEKMESRLEQAAVKAHQLTLALRKRGYEAYEFHDQFSSIVTVGSFDSVGTPRADGKTEINPAAYKIMNTFGADKQNALAQGAGVGTAKTFDNIPCDTQPQLVHVPHRSISADYDRAKLSSLR